MRYSEDLSGVPDKDCIAAGNIRFRKESAYSAGDTASDKASLPADPDFACYIGTVPLLAVGIAADTDLPAFDTASAVAALQTAEHIAEPAAAPTAEVPAAVVLAALQAGAFAPELPAAALAAALWAAAFAAVLAAALRAAALAAVLAVALRAAALAAVLAAALWAAAFAAALPAQPAADPAEALAAVSYPVLRPFYCSAIALCSL